MPQTLEKISDVYEKAKEFRSMGINYRGIATYLFNATGVPFSGVTVKHWLADANTAVNELAPRASAFDEQPKV